MTPAIHLPSRHPLHLWLGQSKAISLFAAFPSHSYLQTSKASFDHVEVDSDTEEIVRRSHAVGINVDGTPRDRQIRHMYDDGLDRKVTVTHDEVPERYCRARYEESQCPSDVDEDRIQYRKTPPPPGFKGRPIANTTKPSKPSKTTKGGKSGGHGF